MLLVYPVGIPCMYLVLVWRSRDKLNPDAFFVASDIICNGALTDDSVPVTGEMRRLANIMVMIHGAAEDAEKHAIERHAEDLDNQKQSNARARAISEDSQRAIARRAGREINKMSIARESIASRVSMMHDRHLVPKNWQDYLPEEAAVVINLRETATVIESELVRQHRDANASVRILSFLVGAYEVRVTVGIINH